MAVQAHIEGTSILRGTTYYHIKVSKEKAEWVVLRRYNDFLALDASLSSAGGVSQIALPEKGMFGFRHAWNIGSFNEQRRQTLEHYLMFLVRQAECLTSNSHIADFLRPTGTGDRPVEDTDFCGSEVAEDLTAPSPEPRIKLLPEVPIGVRIPHASRNGLCSLLSTVSYQIVLESPGSTKTVQKQYRELLELHQSLESKGLGSSMPVLPSLRTFEMGSQRAHDRLRVQLEAYLSFLCHHPLVLLDDTLWRWFGADSLTTCVVRMVVTYTLGDPVALIYWIEELDEMLRKGGDISTCVSPTILVALSAPLENQQAPAQICLVICRILEGLIVKQRVRRMFLSRNAGGVSILLAAYSRGGRLADAARRVFEACAEDDQGVNNAEIPSRRHAAQGNEEGLGPCCICFDKEKSHALFPCGHLCVCIDCAQYLHAQRSQCPLCRRNIENQAQVFLS